MGWDTNEHSSAICAEQLSSIKVTCDENPRENRATEARAQESVRNMVRKCLGG